MKHNKSVLKDIPLFSELSDEQLEKIFSFSNIKKFDKGEMIFFDTEPYQGFYCVIEGLVKIFKISKEGKEHVLHFIHQNNTFAEVPLFEKYGEMMQNNLTYPANAMSIDEDTVVIMIPAKFLYEFLKDNIDVTFKLLSTLSKRMRHLNKQIENLSLADVPKRLAAYLINKLERERPQDYHYVSDSPEDIMLRISRSDLAAYIGTINETLSRTLNKFQKEGLIKVDGKAITIINLSALRKLSQ